MGIFGNKEVIDSAGNLVEKVGDVFDKNFTSKEERDQSRNELVSGVSELISETNRLRQQVILAEAAGNWLQRTWRPLLMLTFGFIIVTTWFIFPVINIFIRNSDISAFIMQLKEATQFWDVVELGLGGYVIGRSAEKISDSVSKNLTITKK